MRWKYRDLEVEVLYTQAGLATQIFVQAGKNAILFDAGDGTLRDLCERGRRPQDLVGIFLTHGHADHIAGLYGLLGYLWAEGHTGKLIVGYPRGACEVKAVLAAFQRCYGRFIPYSLEVRPLEDGMRVCLPEVEVWAKSVKHWHSIRGKPLAPAPALGYRLVFQGQVVALTGDSAFCPALEELVRDADLALIEATLDVHAPSEQQELLHLTRAQAEMLGRLAREAYFIHTPRT